MKNFIANHKKPFVLFLVLSALTVTSGLMLLFSNEAKNNASILNNNSTTTRVDILSVSSPTTTATTSKEQKKTPLTDTKQIPAIANATINVVLKIDDTIYSAKIAPASSAYDLMNVLSAQSKLQFKTKLYAGLGQFVEEINGRKNNAQTGEYWIFYVNGQAAAVGISNYFLKPNDIITWKYEKAKF